MHSGAELRVQTITLSTTSQDFRTINVKIPYIECYMVMPMASSISSIGHVLKVSLKKENYFLDKRVVCETRTR